MSTHAPSTSTCSPPRPRVRGLPFAGSAVEMLRDQLGFLERISHEHGDVVEFRVLGDRVVLFNHPDAIEQLLVTERDKLIKDSFTRHLSLLLGRGLLVSEGTFWRKQRRLAQPAFHRQRIDAYGDVMVGFTERAIAGWTDGERRDVHHDMMRLTLDIVAKTLFGVEIADVARKIESALEVLLARFSGIQSMVPLALPLPFNVRARRAIEQLDDIVYGIIRERRRSGDTGDLLSMLLAATSDEDGQEGMDDKQLRDEALTLLLAGHETTALTLTFAVHLLGQHPAVADRLAREADAVLGERAATAADLPRLTYAESVVRESMRLYPPAWAIGREATAPCRIGGQDIAPGTQLWAAQWLVHRDPRWFVDPLAFRPERWDDGLAKRLPRYAYFPFGGGPRVCIGNAFAMMESVLLLVTIARRFRIEPVSTSAIEVLPTVTLRPKHGLPAVVRRRGR